LTVSVQAGEKLSLEQIRAFLQGSHGVGFKGLKRAEMYGWVNQALREVKYQELKRQGRGLVRRYVQKLTGRNAEEGSVITENAEVGIVLGVVANVEIQGGVLRIHRYGHDRTEQALPACLIAARRAVIGVGMKCLVGGTAESGREGIRCRPGHRVRSGPVGDCPPGGKSAGADAVEILTQQRGAKLAPYRTW
jgi:hypothetical protein